MGTFLLWYMINYDMCAYYLVSAPVLVIMQTAYCKRGRQQWLQEHNKTVSLMDRKTLQLHLTFSCIFWCSHIDGYVK